MHDPERSRAQKIVVHADVDAFYASVEQRDNYHLRGLAIAVGGSPAHRGVIMTASYEARSFGVHSAMPSRTAVGLCPQLVIVPPHFEAYQGASRTIMEIFRRRASSVEPVSMDEAFLDITERAGQFDEAIAYARAIKREVFEATALTISLGVAGSRQVAKIASDFEKPDGFTAVPPEQSRQFLAPLPIRRLWGIGPKTEAVLARAGIERVGHLADAEEEWIISRVGPWALRWRSLARGFDSSGVAPRAESKQMSREITFDRDTRDRQKLHETLSDMARRLARSLEADSPPQTVHIKIRYADFRTVTRQRRTGAVREADEICHHAVDLLDRWWDGRAVRLIGLGLSNFVIRPKNQLLLFE